MQKPFHITRLFVAYSIVTLFLFSCREKPKDTLHKINEGEISYKISYTSEAESHHMSFLYPREMTLFFKDSLQRLSFKGGVGLYDFDFIFSDKCDTVFTLLKIQLLDKKLFVPTLNEKLLMFSESVYEETTIVPDETKEIAGMTAKKATLKSINIDIPDIEVWYTDEISVKTPNQNTPFDKVPGVLLESKIVYKNVAFSFKAHKISAKEIRDNIFKVPSDYELTSISEIEELLYTVF